MSASFLTLPMRVAVRNRHRKQAVYRIRIVMRAGDRTSRITLSGPAFATDDNLPAAFFRSAAKLLPGCGNWDRTIERTHTPAALVRSRFLQLQRWIVNFCRPQHTAGKCFSFLRSLLKHRQEPSCVDLVLFSENHLPSFAAAHGPTMKQKDARSHEQVARKRG